MNRQITLTMPASDLMPTVCRARLEGTDQTQVRLGDSYDLYAFVSAAEARDIAAAWVAMADRIADRERERTMPTLTEARADRDDCIGVEPF